MKKYLIFLIALGFSSNAMAAYLLEEAALGARRVAHLWKTPVSLPLATIPRTSSALLSRSFFSGVSVHSFTLMGKPVSTFPLFSFRGFSSSTEIYGFDKLRGMSVREMLWERKKKLRTSDSDDKVQESVVFSKAINERRMYKDPSQSVLNPQSSLEEAQKCVEKNCYKTLKDLGLFELSTAAKELSDVAASVLTELKTKGNIDSLVYSRPYLDHVSQVSYGWTLTMSNLKLLKGEDFFSEEKNIDKMLVAIENVNILRKKLTEKLYKHSR